MYVNNSAVNTSKLRVMPLKDAHQIANSEDPDQTAPRGAPGLHCLHRLIYVCTVCISIQRLRSFTISISDNHL